MQKKNIIEISITSILIFVLLFAVINALNKGRASEEAPSQEKISAEDLYGALEEKSKNLELKRDPFSLAPIIPSEKYSSDTHLNGIVWDKTSPMAIINDEIVKIGDSVGGKIVVDIKQDRVILNDGSKDFELRLE
jgi:hypothetical protein